MTDSRKGSVIVALVAIVIALAFYVMGIKENVSLGSTNAEASDYSATSTAQNTVYGGSPVGGTIKSGAGSFGSVIITGANTGSLNFYNATTSNVLARKGNKASSTILMASIPSSTLAGTYVFDVGYTDGLLVVLEGGIMPTTTISYR